LKAVRQHYDEQGLEHPDDLYPPELIAGAALYLKALQVCGADRPVSLGMSGVIYGRIPFLTLDRFAVREGIEDPDAFERLSRLVSLLDAEETDRMNKEANKKA